MWPDPGTSQISFSPRRPRRTPCSRAPRQAARARRRRRTLAPEIVGTRLWRGSPAADRSLKTRGRDGGDAVANDRRTSRHSGSRDRPAPSGCSRPRTTIAFRARRLRRGLDHHLAADREADATDASRVDVRPALQVRDRGVDVALALPAERGSGHPRSRPSPRRSKRRTPYPCRARSFARSCEDARPGKEITAAPFRDGTYQPSSRSPSLVVKCTFSWATPSRRPGRLRAGCVGDDVADGEREQDDECDEQRADRRAGACARSAARGGHRGAVISTASRRRGRAAAARRGSTGCPV